MSSHTREELTPGLRWHRASCYESIVSKIPKTQATRRTSLAHTQHPVNLLYPQPVQDIGHQRLKSHVLDSGNIFGALKIIRGSVGSSFPRIINHWPSNMSVNTRVATALEQERTRNRTAGGLAMDSRYWQSRT